MDFHWVKNKIIMNRVSGGCLETLPRDISSLANLKFFPIVDDQKFQRHNYTILVFQQDGWTVRSCKLYFFSFFETVKCHASPNKTDEKFLSVTEWLLLKKGMDRRLNTDFTKVLRNWHSFPYMYNWMIESDRCNYHIPEAWKCGCKLQAFPW